jgi:hypothetical protein
MYLGDGYIARVHATFALRVYLNRRHRDIIERVKCAIHTTLPGPRVTEAHRTDAAVTVVTCYSIHWPSVFPQHGRGRKHLRPIVLDPWQRVIVDRYPWDFIRGCIDSDGCRHRRIVKGRDYPAYSFRNRSGDILSLFTTACDLAGLRWRRSNQETISIARRPDVARLDAIFAQAAASQTPSAMPSSLTNTSTPGA